MEAFVRGIDGRGDMASFYFSNSESAYTKINPTSLWPGESLRARDRGPPGLLLF